jgi:hypothetical protein
MRMGYQVVAVEPTAELRNAGVALHPTASIEWIDDSLPELAGIALWRKFDFAMITAVWMHLDEEERTNVMPRVTSLLYPKGA